MEKKSPPKPKLSLEEQNRIFKERELLRRKEGHKKRPWLPKAEHMKRKAIEKASWKPHKGPQTEILSRMEFEMLYGGARGGGKKIDKMSRVLTDNSWKLAGDITLEDKLVAPDGSYTKLLGIFPEDSVNMYHIEFIDGRTIDCDGEHLWKVYGKNHGHRDGWLVRNTEQLLKNPSNWSIPLIERSPGKRWTGSDPYIFGLVLGDGSLTGNHTVIYTVDSEIMEYLRERNWRVHKYESQNTTMCYCLKEDFRVILGTVSGHNKQIPKELLESDNDTRLSLLQGLMDTDGTCGKEGQASFCNKSLKLCEGLIYLVRSLGGKARIHEINRGIRIVKGYETDGFYYEVNVSYVGKFNPFRLSRKAERVRMNQVEDKLGIKSIVRTKDSPAVCFKVEHPSHLYVIQDFIVTHNTSAGIVWISESVTHPLYRGLVLRRNFDDLSDWIERAKIMYFNLDGQYRSKPDRFVFPSGAIIRLGHIKDEDAYTKYQGHEYHRMLIEELTHIPTELLYLNLIASCRSTVEGLKPQVLSTTNPGGPGHLWVKKRFVDVSKPGIPYYTLDEETGLKKWRIFIPAKVEDNPTLMKNDPSYVAFLNSLPEDQRKAWRDGSWDVFDVKGAYYTHDIAQAWREERICRMPYERNLPVVTAWDLGMHDEMSIVCVQIYGQEIRFINCIHDEGQGIEYYMKNLNDIYEGNLGYFYFPHDIAVRELGTGRSRLEIFENLGVYDYLVAPKLSPEDGIQAVRSLFSRFWFNEQKCEYLISALTQYRKEYDEKNAVYRNKPLHSWASHMADAVRCFSLCHEDKSQFGKRMTPPPVRIVRDAYDV